MGLKGNTNMNPVIRKLHEAQLRKDLPEFRAGDTVRVNVRLQEGEGEKVKERLQAFEGVVISKKGRASSATFKVRRARLYYLRDLKGKAARIKRADREEVAAVATAGTEAKA